MRNSYSQLIYFSAFSITMLCASGLVLVAMFRAGVFEPARNLEDRTWYRPAAKQEIVIVDLAEEVEVGNVTPDETECRQIIEDEKSSREFQLVIWNPPSEPEQEELRRELKIEEQNRIAEKWSIEFARRKNVRAEQEKAERLERHRLLMANEVQR